MPQEICFVELVELDVAGGARRGGAWASIPVFKIKAWATTVVRSIGHIDSVYSLEYARIYCR